MVRRGIGLVVLAIFCMAAVSAALAGLPAFPGAEGVGRYAVGGRGGKVFLVTNLNDAGSGSFREACEAEGPRIVVFRVGGLIELESSLRIENPYITIAGQTAPGDGICLKNYPFQVRNTHDVIVRYIRARPGDVAKKEMDAFSVGSSRNVIVDHCSASWGSDETLSVTSKGTTNVTVQWCMITESLNESVHHKGAHGYGSLLRIHEGAMTFHHNLYAHHRSRNPRPGSYEAEIGMLLDFRNNLIYDWGSRAGYNSGDRLRMNYVGNYLKAGPSTKDPGYAFSIGSPWVAIFMGDNYLEGAPEKNRANWLMIRAPEEFAAESEAKFRVAKPFPPALVKTESPHEAYKRILADAGATLPVRDAVDARIIEEIRTGGGRIINSQADVGGWPEYKSAPAPPDNDKDGMPDAWEIGHNFDPANASDSNKDADSDGYTNIEEFLNGTDPRRADRA